MATKTVQVPGGGFYVNLADGNTVQLAGAGFFVDQAVVAGGGVVWRLAGSGGLAGNGGLAGPHGGLAG